MKKELVNLLKISALGLIAFLPGLSACSRGPEVSPKAITVQADDKMKYDVTAFEVQRGQKVSVTFKNAGTAPKASMGHNFVLLDQRITPSNINSFLDKASMAADQNYVPSGAREVLAHSKLLGPNETEVVEFSAPQVPGDYLYVCTFPGHYSQGTKGIMTVK